MLSKKPRIVEEPGMVYRQQRFTVFPRLNDDFDYLKRERLSKVQLQSKLDLGPIETMFVQNTIRRYGWVVFRDHLMYSENPSVKDLLMN